jgi:hypothetical protein
MSTVAEDTDTNNSDKIKYSATHMSPQVAQSQRIIKSSVQIKQSSMTKKQLENAAAAQAEEDEKPKRRITASVKETGFDSMKYYMKTMGNHELLKKNEEIILAREIQILIKWEEQREELEAKLMR